MVVVLLYCLFFIGSVTTSQWQTESASLSRAGYGQSVGIHNDTIYIIGGSEYQRSLVKYDTTTNTITADNATDSSITTNIHCFAQGWVQVNNTLFIIPFAGTYLVTYNMDTNIMNQWNNTRQIFPQSVGYNGCLVEWKSFLFVIGGWTFVDHHDVYLNTTQIFNISSTHWLNNTPSLNQQKDSMACVIHPTTQMIYTFGGYNGSAARISSIETLSVNNMINIQNTEWVLITNIILPGRAGSRAVIFGEDIIIIGGYDGGQAIQQNLVFHTINNTIRQTTDTMTKGLVCTATIFDNSYTLYTFGGVSFGASVSTIQSIALGPPPTKNPTAMPTQNPTQPTTNPSLYSTQLSTTVTSNPTNNPFEPVININVTINQSNISTTAVINTVQESVDNYFNDLSVSFNYTLDVDFIRNTDNATVIGFGIYTTDISNGEYIDVDRLDEQITNDLNENFGDGVIKVVVTKVDKEAVYEAQKTFFQQVTAVIAVLFIIIFIVAFIHAKKCTRNDYFKAGALFTGALQMLDCISDIFFIVLIRYHPEFTVLFSFSSPLFLLFMLSVFFIVVTVLWTLYQLHYTVNKYWLVNDEIRVWLNTYSLYLYVLSLITGSSFVAVQICSSGAFGMRIFSMPLCIKDCNLFLYQRVYSVVLMENIPQLALAIWFIVATQTHIDAIVYISMVFSGISIITSLLNLITARKLVKTQDYCHISLSVTGDMFNGKNITFCSQNTNDIKNNFSIALGLKSSMVEILRPQEISHGLRITIVLYISNEKCETLKVKDTIDNEHTTGSLSAMFKNAWDLSSLPNIDNIICEQIASKHREKTSNNVGTNEMIKLGEYVTH